jgi:hypothetical protein
MDSDYSLTSIRLGFIVVKVTSLGQVLAIHVHNFNVWIDVFDVLLDLLDAALLCLLTTKLVTIGLVLLISPSQRQVLF